jgi:hypothetical protein
MLRLYAKNKLGIAVSYFLLFAGYSNKQTALLIPILLPAGDRFFPGNHSKANVENHFFQLFRL